MITINQAISRGRSFIILPSVLIMLLTPAIIFLITEYILNIEIFFMIFVAIGIVCSIPAWLWWSYKVPKWKIWAYGNINPMDIEGLKKKAIANGIIWPDGFPFNKTEIWSKADNEKMKQIALKYPQEFRWR